MYKFYFLADLYYLQCVVYALEYAEQSSCTEVIHFVLCNLLKGILMAINFANRQKYELAEIKFMNDCQMHAPPILAYTKLHCTVLSPCHGYKASWPRKMFIATNKISCLIGIQWLSM